MEETESAENGVRSLLYNGDQPYFKSWGTAVVYTKFITLVLMTANNGT